MEKLQKPKGTVDIYGKDGKTFIYLQNLINDLCDKYQYQYIKTPMFEASEVFHRGVGATTDIVTKETYDFVDRGDRKMTLRPEYTAGIVRSFIENKLYSESQPQKFYYFGSAFRYERPQAGRLREHTQFGVEVFGVDNPMIDAEVISIAVNLFKILGLEGIRVKINSLGDLDSRIEYREKLIEYFKPHLNELCEDCKNRLEKNPLRVLDCKVDNELEIMKNAPRMIDFLNEESKKRFQKLKEYLEILNIEYIVDSNLVRGLDYYSHTVFEVQADIPGFGSQNTLCGGGCYSGLVSSLGGPDTFGIGFGMGIERLMLALEKENIDLLENDRLDIYIMNLTNDSKEIVQVIDDLRLSGYKVETDYLSRSLKSQFKTVDRLNPRYIVFIGDDEIKNNMVKVKDNDTKFEEEIELDCLVEYFNCL